MIGLFLIGVACCRAKRIHCLWDTVIAQNLFLPNEFCYPADQFFLSFHKNWNTLISCRPTWIWLDGTKFGRTTQNCHVGRQKIVFRVNSPLTCKNCALTFSVEEGSAISVPSVSRKIESVKVGPDQGLAKSAFAARYCILAFSVEYFLFKKYSILHFKKLKSCLLKYFMLNLVVCNGNIKTDTYIHTFTTGTK
jgi:hypothetical protein